MAKRTRAELLNDFIESIDIEQLAQKWYWEQYNTRASGEMGTYFPPTISDEYDEDDCLDFAAEADYRLSVTCNEDGAW